MYLKYSDLNLKVKLIFFSFHSQFVFFPFVNNEIFLTCYENSRFSLASSGLWNIHIFGILFGCCWCAIFSMSVSIVNSIRVNARILSPLSLLDEEEKWLFWVMLFNSLSKYYCQWVVVFFRSCVLSGRSQFFFCASKSMQMHPIGSKMSNSGWTSLMYGVIVFEFTRYFQGGKNNYCFILIPCKTKGEHSMLCKWLLIS